MNFSTLQGLAIPQGTVTQITDASGRVLWSAGRTSELEFKSASAFTLGVKFPGSLTTLGWNGTMEYNNGSGWQTWDGSTISSGATKDGQCIYVRGTGNTTVTGYNVIDTNVRPWVLTGSNIECNGNIETLLDYATARTGAHPTMASYCYYCMFFECTSLITPPDLPATALTSYCYNRMFYGCTGLTKAPKIPATKAGANSCQYMFHGCTSLTTAPALPATTLGSECYNGMFYGCTSLTKAPALPATTLNSSCYAAMFAGCTNLTAIPALRATTLVTGCYNSMFQNCSKVKVSDTKTGTYTKAYAFNVTNSYPPGGALSGMFSGTGGTFTGAPAINTTYYLDESNTIV